MQHALYNVVRAEGDSIIWVVIIVATIIARLIKAVKGGGKLPPIPREGPAPSNDVSPQAELKKFLEGLSSPPQAPAAPPPLPAPVRRPAYRARPARAAVVASAPVETAEPPVFVPQRPETPAAPAAARYETRRKARLTRGVLRSEDLRGVANLRRAVALREVLDLPLGLR